MHPTQHTTVPRRPVTAGEAVAMMAVNLQRLAQAHNVATAARLNIAPAPLHPPSTISHHPQTAACLLAASPMADNPWHVGIVFGLLILGSIGAVIIWARKVAPQYPKEFTEPETDPVITAAPGSMAPSCAHLVPLHHHCPFCAGTHQPLQSRAKAALEAHHNAISAHA